MSYEVEHGTRMRTLTKAFDSVMSNDALSVTEKSAKLDDIKAELEMVSKANSLHTESARLAAGADMAAEATEKAVFEARKSGASIGELVVADASYAAAIKGLRSGEQFSRAVEIKSSNTVTEGSTYTGDILTGGTSGSAIVPNFLPGIVDLRFRPLRIADLFAQGSTDSPTITYVKESSFSNNAAAALEGGTYAQSDDAVTRVVEPTVKLAHLIKVTDEMVQDAPQYTSFLNGRLLLGLQLAEETELVSGSGTAPHLNGLLNRSGLQTAVVTSAGLTAVKMIEGLYNQMTNIRWNAFVEPSAIVINPVDWQSIRLGKDSQGQYYAGGPFTGAYGNGSAPVLDSLWGVPVVVTSAIAQGAAIVGGFRECGQIFRRQGVTVEMTNSNGTDFASGLISVRASERLALAVYRAGGFGQVTFTA